MPFAITGAKYAAASVSAVGTSTVTVSTAPFVQADFAKQRLVGLWTSGAVFKGMTWARRWVSTNQIQLEKPFFDPATGLTVTQAVGDQVLVSKDFSESVVAGLAVSGRVVSITDTCTFGVNGNQMGTCLYDENKLVNATFGTLLSGGLVVFGKLDDYATDSVSSSIDWQSTNANPILCNDAAVNFCGYGGRWEAVPAGGGGAYFIGGNNQGTAGNTVVLTGIECPNDLLTNTAGGAWARNPTRHQLINCYSVTTSTNAIMRRWGNGITRGGQYKFPNDTNQPISAFGSDAAGTYTVAANPGDRAVILDMGNGPALVRSNSPVSITFNFTNLITTDRRSVTGAAGGLIPNPNGTNTLRFSDPYTGLQAGTVGVVLNNAGVVVDSVASSDTNWSPSLLLCTTVGATDTINATSWTYGLKKYGFQAVGGTITPSTYNLGAAGSPDNVTFGGAVNQLADAGVTLPQAQAAALTVFDNLDQVYDAVINWGSTNTTNAQYPSLTAYPVAASGTALLFGLRSLVADATASVPFAVNTTTHTITVKATTLAAGVKFKTFSTSGTATAINGATITASYTDANSSGEIRVRLTSLTDTVQMRRTSDNSLLSSRTGAGGFAVAPSLVGVSVYFERKTGSALVMSTITTPVTLTAGVNPDVPLYAGAEVQVAQAGRIEILPTLAEMTAGGIALQSTLTTLASTNQTEHDATHAAIAALPAPLNSTQTQAAAAAALVAYDGVVPADLAGLALEASVQTRATQTSVNAIPTNPILTTDTRLNNLDAAISTRSTLTAPQVRTELATELGRLDVAVSTRLATTAYTAPTTAPTAAQNASAVRTELATELARVDVATSTRLASSAYVAPTTAPTAADNAAAVRTNLATELGRIDATVSSRSTQTSVTAIPTNPLLTNDARVNNLDATVSSRLASSAYVAAPTLASIRADIERTGGMLDTVPTLAEVEASTVLAKQSGFTGLATATNVTNAQTAIVSEVNANEAKIDAVKADTAAIKAKTDTLVNTVAPTAAQIRTEIETSGSKLDTAAKKSKAAWVNTL